MKSLRIMKLAAVTMAIVVVAGCGSKRKVVKETPVAQNVVQQQEFLQKVSDNAQHARFITSKVKFSVEVGAQQLTLTGNLKMKRDDVIRLQLMAFGFVEAGRLEFTKDYVLVMDRINKQYLKVPYQQLDFLRNSGLDFYALQALFWNELFQPGKQHITDELLKSYDTDMGGENAVISMESGKLSYRWLADKDNAQVNMANILYKDKFRGNYQLNWDYLDFKANGRKKFPMDHKVKFTTPDKEVKFEMVLNYMGADEDWETRTEVSGKYLQVSVDEILRRFMSL
jgi:outer membrane murein-binding lipoprotein Lpp